MNQRIPKPNEDEKIINKLNLATPELIFISIARAGRLTEGVIKTLIYNGVAFTRRSAIIKNKHCWEDDFGSDPIWVRSLNQTPLPPSPFQQFTTLIKGIRGAGQSLACGILIASPDKSNKLKIVIQKCSEVTVGGNNSYCWHFLWSGSRSSTGLRLLLLNDLKTGTRRFTGPEMKVHPKFF